MFAQVPWLDPAIREEIGEWLIDTIIYSRNRSPMRRGTIEAILTADFQAQLHQRLYAAERAAGGWQIVLIEPNRVSLTKPEEPVRQRRERRTEKMCQALTQDGRRERT